MPARFLFHINICFFLYAVPVSVPVPLLVPIPVSVPLLVPVPVHEYIILNSYIRFFYIDLYLYLFVV